MTWLKVCDTGLTHPKVFAIRALKHKIATGEAVVGMVMLASTWSGAHDTDHFIADTAVMVASPDHHELLSEVARKVGLWTRAPAATRKRNNGQAGWIVKVGEGEVFHLLTREQKATMAAHRRLGRSVQGRVDLHLRDGDQCRYCATAVEPNDRKSHLGRTFDHPDPDVPNELVVACRGCNLTKGKRTVEQWAAQGGRTLMPEPAKRGDPLYLDPATRDWLTDKGIELPNSLTTQPPARTAQADDAATQRPAADQAREQHGATRTEHDSTTRSDPNPIPAGMAGHAAPGRVGTGRDGSHPGDPPPRRERTRGSRGKRGRGAPPPS